MVGMAVGIAVVGMATIGIALEDETAMNVGILKNGFGRVPRMALIP
jgi:hypothetical protein